MTNTVSDCVIDGEVFELFNRNQYPKRWASVSLEDKLLLKELVNRLNALADNAIRTFPGERGMTSFHTTFQLGGATARRLTVGCFSSAAPHREYALSLRLSLNVNGIRLCLTLGSAMPLRVSDLNKAACETFLSTSQKRLNLLPSSMIHDVVTAIRPSKTRYCRTIAVDNTFSQTHDDFKDFRTWLAYASSLDGKGASVITFLDAPNLTTPINIAQEFHNHCRIFDPVIDFV